MEENPRGMNSLILCSVRLFLISFELYCLIPFAMSCLKRYGDVFGGGLMMDRWQLRSSNVVDRISLCCLTCFLLLSHTTTLSFAFCVLRFAFTF
jgi:hypothetical protein